MHMIMLVLNDPERLDAVLEAWEAAGLPGATIVESIGIRRLREAGTRIHARFAFGHAPGMLEEGHYTLLAVVPDEPSVQRCVTATEAVVGDLNEPDTGILAAWPLSLVKGVPAKGGQAGAG
jgi:hypothetical protein